ncbi:MAG: mechanosensitive ion channel family protein [Pseudomonadota bacterium]|uniref:Small-conductance mechanosensitive channel n=1 Tax=Alteromonas oceani TaxID=2071609 RepID=A0ABV7K0W4_9ALTE|nr:mechanosensitive ion channel family protein [Alteromonas oceani]MEC9260004.1 mechanosensitive ion channel family protein [Pseudomonadota bacterium]
MGSSTSELVTSLEAYWQAFIVKLPAIALGLVILMLTLWLAGRVSQALIRPVRYLSSSPLLRSVSQRAVSLVLILLALYIFLKLSGLTEFAVAIMSGTGVLGLILGFAFRDIAENMIASLLLTVQRPFRIDDVVQINSYTGVVQKVTTRATTLVDFDGNHIQIPNAVIYKGTIKNLTANPKMRGQFTLGIGYDADCQQAQRLALQLIGEHPNVLKEPEPLVLVDELGSATVNLKVYFWIDVESTSVIKMASVLMRDLVELFTVQGISMPDDAREVIFPQGVPVTMVNSQEQVSEQKAPVKQRIVSKPAATPEKHSAAHDDVSSENDDIRRQAEQARAPEQGANILS